MNKKLIILSGILVLIIVAVVAIWALRNILIKPSNEVVQNQKIDETILSGSNSEQISSGQFTRIDSIHQGSGTAAIFNTAEGPVLKFTNFSVTPGPDLFVYLSPNSSGEELGQFVSLGALKKNSGEQVYNLPKNFSEYKTVVIWCRAFSTTFSKAELK